MPSHDVESLARIASAGDLAALNVLAEPARHVMALPAAAAVGPAMPAAADNEILI